MAIPKIIHSVWVGGGKKSELVKKCEASWRKHLPDYTFIEWNEGNYDFDSCPYARRMYDLKAWGFLSDPMRMHALKEYGGFYLDADMLVHKSLNPLLDAELVMGFMFDCALETAIIGASKECPIIADLHKFYYTYGNGPIISNSPVTWYFLKNVAGFRLTGETQVLPHGVHLYQRKYFGSPTYSRKMGYATHLGMGSWSGTEGVEQIHGRVPLWVKKGLRYLLGSVLYCDLHQRYLLPHVTEFYPTYCLHKRGESGTVYPEQEEQKLVLKMLEFGS